MSKSFDIVLWGATGFTGGLVAEYLSRTYPQTALRWAIAGRSATKLQAVQQKLLDSGQLLGEPPSLLLADSNDESSLKELAKQTKVIISTVGPFAYYGSLLVKVCAQQGTHYCDLTGEVPWMQEMISAYQKDAEASGAKIVHCCGFDSTPSDLGVYFLQQRALETFGKAMPKVRMYVTKAKGGFSGGTVHSLVNVVEELSNDRDKARIAANAFALVPEKLGSGKRANEVMKAEYDPLINRWIGPFVMASINTRVVIRSNYLLKRDGGVSVDELDYREAQSFGKGGKGALVAHGISGVLGAFIFAIKKKPSRNFLKRFVLPDQGEGPDVDPENPGFYQLKLVGVDESGNRIDVQVDGDADPGYGSTSKMLSEAAIALAKDETLGKDGGFLTPASAFGEKLIARLEDNAGVTFSEL